MEEFNPLDYIYEIIIEKRTNLPKADNVGRIYGFVVLNFTVEDIPMDDIDTKENEKNPEGNKKSSPPSLRFPNEDRII